MVSTPRSFHLTDGSVSLVLLTDGGMPRPVHWGAALGPTGDAAAVAAAVERSVPGGGPDADAPLGLIAEAMSGWFGTPGIVGSRADGSGFAPQFVLDAADAAATSVRFQLSDPHAQLGLELRLALMPSGVVTVDAQLTNRGDGAYRLDALRVSLEVPGQATELLTVGGRWTNEFVQTRTPWVQNLIAVQNRRLKTSHERLGAVFAGSAGFTEQAGEVWACHIGWSGNFELLCDSQTDARRTISAGELLTPGEVQLAPGEAYSAPTVYAAYSGTGLNAISNAFHAHLRSLPTHPVGERKVILNTWEAVYFNHDLATLTALADRAAEVGIERFVLDDGWFHLRRDDRAGLGDWWVDPAVWPNGLTPLINHVRGLGMEFGIWVEPEMVNPNSDVYRAHPEWALHDHRYPLELSRNQLVLDLGQQAVRDYLFEHLNALLRDHDVAYVKWDMNRDLAAPTSLGRAGGHAQTLGVYELFRRLRAAHPYVEFESCASGGGRADFAILEHTRRIWTSDSIDALDRQSIQRGFSLLFPPELMGSHIGSGVTHTTGRRHTLAFRAATAFFGALGVEWNLLERNAEERAELAAIIAVHKRLRGLLHSGRVLRGDMPDPNMWLHGVVAHDAAEAVFAVVRTDVSASLHSPAARLPGLDPDSLYLVEPLALGAPHWGPARRQQQWLADGLELTGRQLAVLGLRVPVLHPESALLVHLTRVR